MEKKILDILNGLSIQYHLYYHGAVFTCDESKDIKIDFEGIHNKTLFIKDAYQTQFFLIIIPCEKRLNLKDLQNFLKVRKLTFCNNRELKDMLGLTPGSVSPFGIINNKERNIHIIIDRGIWSDEFVQFHPCINTATISLKRVDFEKFLKIYAKSYSVQNL